MKRAFAEWLLKVLLPARLPGATIPEVGDLGEVRAMLSERVREWTKPWVEQGREQGRLEGHREGRLEGHREGRMEGHREGRLEGRREGSISLLLRQLSQRFGEISTPVLNRVEAASLEQLQSWGDRVLTASSIEDVFKDE